MSKRVELTEQIIEILEECPFKEGTGTCCNCVLFGPCLEYFTGDNSFNQNFT